MTGEGTHNHSFACAGLFSIEDTHLRLQPLATIHTPYVPAGGQGVDCGITRDGRWMVYNDTVDGAKQICAVRVDL